MTQIRKCKKRKTNTRTISSKWWKVLYALAIAYLLVLIPHIVSDGHSWKFLDVYDITYAKEAKIKGFDVSKHNGVIQWGEINQGLEEEDHRKMTFVFIKATEGTDMTDINFKKNWKRAVDHNLIRGAYHFFNSRSNPREQARNYLTVANLKKGDLRPVVDFETEAPSQILNRTLTQRLQTWLNVVENKVGVKPIIYTNAHIYRKYIKGKLEDYPVWLSSYSSKVEVDNYENLTFWQYTDRGRLSGINEYVDLNVYIGSRFGFQKYLIR